MPETRYQYRDPLVVERRRLSDLEPIMKELQQKEGLRLSISDRFNYFLKHPEKDDWAVVVKGDCGYVLIRGGLDYMFAPANDEISCRGCTKAWCGDCRVFKDALQGVGHKIRPL